MIRVLIVDDREESRYLLNTLLKGSGYEVEIACHGTEALDKARQNPPQLIISDLLMPVMDGYTLLRQWRADDRLKQIPFVVYTATYTDPKDEQLALSLGADAFILKPAEPADLIARLKKILENHTARGVAASPLSAPGAPACIPIAAPEEEETRNLRQYSEVLINKLEDKMEELEKANHELQRDVIRRKQAEDALHESESRYRILADSGQALIWTSGSDKKCNYFNQPWLTFTGRPLEQELGDGWAEGVHPDDLDRCIKIYTGAFDRRERFSMDYRLRRHDGEFRWIQDDGTPRYDSQGNFLGYIGHCLDITERKRAEEALRLAHERLRRIVDANIVGIVIANADGSILEANDYYLRLIGFTREELTQGKVDWRAITPTEWRAVDEQAICELRECGTTKPHEKEYVRRDGTRIPVLLAGAQLPGEEQQIAVFALDLTERKQAETHIRHLNRVYAVLSDINETIVREANPEAMLAAACRTAVEKGGFQMAWIGLVDMPANRLKLVAHAGVAADTLSLLNQALDGVEQDCGCNFTMQALKTGGHVVCNDIAHDPQTVSWREAALQRNHRSMAALPLKSGDKTIGAFSLYAGEPGFFDEEELRLLDEMAADISFALEVSRREVDRRRVEEARTRLATVVEQATEAIVITDADATILYVNPAFEKVTGYTRQDVMGQNPRLLKSGKQDAAFYRQMWDTLDRGEVWKGHFINKKKSGALYEEEATISPVRDAAGRIVNYVAVKRDVTQEMVLEAQLRQSQKMDAIGQLASGVAHDFNNILTVIHGNASLQLLADLNPVERSDCTQQIIQAAERAAGLTRQLLLFSRKQVMQPASLDLNEVVGGMIKMLNRILGEDITLCSELAPGLPRFYADAGMIEQVLLNLAVNSRDAMPDGGRLAIATGTQTLDEEQARQNPEAVAGRHVFLEVRDTGSGIPPEVMPRIFEPFFTTKEAGKGTGLGLATVHGIVKQHHGWITVQSEAGKGTLFRIYLPAIKEGQAGQAKVTALASLPGGKETILFVEDELALRLLTGNILQRCGYTVIRAESGVAALMVWKECKQPVDLLLTDLVMPDGISGFELASRLQAEKPELKVIFTSGYSARAGKGPPLIEGENFLQKPYSTEKLAQTVRKRLDRKEG